MRIAPNSRQSTIHPGKARSPHAPSSTPWAVCAPGQPRKQWVENVKVTCARGRTALGPASRLTQTPRTDLAPTCTPNPKRTPPGSPAPAPAISQSFLPLSPRLGTATDLDDPPDHSPAENWPWTDPRRGHGDRSQSATKAGSAAAATSMASLGEVSSSVAKSLQGKRSEILQPAAGPASWGARGDAAATRQHFRPCAKSANYLAGESVSSVARQPRQLLSMLGRGLLRVVQSYFARGGTGAEPGVTSPCGLRQLRRNAGSSARHRRCCRLLPGRRAPARPRAPRRLCSPPGLGGRAATPRRAGKGDEAQLPAGFPRFNSERQECRSTVGGRRRRPPRRGVLGFCPQGGYPTGAAGGRKKRERRCDL